MENKSEESAERGPLDQSQQKTQGNMTYIHQMNVSRIKSISTFNTNVSAKKESSV
jgi:hypothetical protein